MTMTATMAAAPVSRTIGDCQKGLAAAPADGRRGAWRSA
jgi:hypothetical protein